jgi:hypothetical protein
MTFSHLHLMHFDHIHPHHLLLHPLPLIPSNFMSLKNLDCAYKKNMTFGFLAGLFHLTWWSSLPSFFLQIA